MSELFVTKSTVKDSSTVTETLRLSRFWIYGYHILSGKFRCKTGFVRKFEHWQLLYKKIRIWKNQSKARKVAKHSLWSLILTFFAILRSVLLADFAPSFNSCCSMEMIIADFFYVPARWPIGSNCILFLWGFGKQCTHNGSQELQLTVFVRVLLHFSMQRLHKYLGILNYGPVPFFGTHSRSKN